MAANVDEVRAELISTGQTDRSPSPGTATLYDVRVSGETAPGAARRYERPGLLLQRKGRYQHRCGAAGPASHPFQLTEIAYVDTPRTGELVRMLTVVSQLPMCRRDELGTEERTACGF